MENEKIPDEDYEIVSLCKRGDADAFEVLVKRHQKKLFNIAFRMLGNHDDASDIVQEACISAYQNINSFKGMSRFFTWLCSIVINLSRNFLKQVKAQRYYEQFSMDDPVAAGTESIKIESIANGPSVLDRLDKKYIQQKVQDCINTLDIEFREVLVLRDIQGFSYNEISTMLEIAEGTVKSRIFRARDNMKNCLKKVLGDR
jgi:RNA polymerase sigma-70 factor (ECF subfamily)